MEFELKGCLSKSESRVYVQKTISISNFFINCKNLKISTKKVVQKK
jgi:hypothetical protein